MFLTSASPYYIQYSSYSPLISKKSLIALSKQRIIQRNLVHFQGFPDCINDKEILLSKEYFGQYGNILEIVLVSKEDKIQNRKINSAYLYTYAAFFPSLPKKASLKNSYCRQYQNFCRYLITLSAFFSG